MSKEKKEVKVAAPKKAEIKKKKPIRPGINSGRILEQRNQLKVTVGMLARSCDSTFTMIQDACKVQKKTLPEFTELHRFPETPIIPFNEKTRDVDVSDVSSMKMMERALMAHDKILADLWKKVRGVYPYKTQQNKSAPKTTRPVKPTDGKPSLGKAMLSKSLPDAKVKDVAEKPVAPRYGRRD
jgi:hypothetical protein